MPWVYKIIQAKTIPDLILCDYFFEFEQNPWAGKKPIEVKCHRCGEKIMRMAGYKFYSCQECKQKTIQKHRELQKQKHARQQYIKISKRNITIPPALREHAVYEKGYWHLNKTGMKKLQELQKNHENPT